MKRIIAAAFLFIAPVVFGNLYAQAPRVRAEQREHQQKIKHGVANGELTRKEAIALEAQQAKIQHDKKVAKADGVVTPAERQQIKHEQRRAQRTIYRQKHDGQDRN